MRKLLMTYLLCSVFAIFCYSQQDSVLKDKKGRILLPQKGNFAVGISANSVFDYIGNLFGGSENNQLNLKLLNGSIIFGKYYLSPTSALRLKLDVNRRSGSYTCVVPQDNNSGAMVNDEFEYESTGFNIYFGFEKRKGTGRLQYGYGVELGGGFHSSTDKYFYGNSFFASNTNPTTTLNFVNSTYYRTYQRNIESNRSGGINIVGRPFLGIEYFFCPKISIGGEMGLTFIKTFAGKSKSVTEYWDLINNNHVVNKYENKSNTSSEIRTDALGGQLFVLFHF